MGEPEVKYGGIHMAEYCELFFRDLGYEQSSQRRGWLKLRFGKSYLDELTASEQYAVVERDHTPSERSHAPGACWHCLNSVVSH